jgi:hypothetical protein
LTVPLQSAGNQGGPMSAREPPPDP